MITNYDYVVGSFVCRYQDVLVVEVNHSTDYESLDLKLETLDPYH